MKKLFLFFTLVIITLNVFTQTNFKRGRIITQDGNTIDGWIDFRTSKMNQRQCKFKISETDGEKIYLPGEIVGYRFTDEGNYYVSHEIEIGGEKKVVFLEYLLQGMMNLYSYDDAQRYFFFEDSDGVMNMITKDPDKIVKATEEAKYTSYISKDFKYTGVLANLFREHQTLVAASQKAGFNQKSMLKIAKMYHEEVCITGEDCIIFENGKPDKDGAIFKFSAYAGLQFFTYKFFMNNKYHNSTSIAPAVGGQMNIINPRWSKSFSAQADISFSRFEKNNFIAKPQNDLIENRTYFFNYEGYTLSGKLGFRYIYSKHRFRPVVEGGFSMLFILGESCDKKTEYANKPLEHFDKHDLKTKFYGYYVGAGFDYNVRKEQAIFIRFLFENYSITSLTGDGLNNNTKDRLQIPQIKFGYTF